MNTQKIIVTGSGGMLGQAICRVFLDAGHDVVALSHADLDISNESAIKTVLSDHSEASLLINCAAFTDVDGCETQKNLATAVNTDGPGYLASWCKNSNITLWHFSTDYVFDGTKSSPYVETDPVAPLNIYGESKLGGEQQIQAVLDGGAYAIFRTQWLFGSGNTHFCDTIRKLAVDQDELTVVADQFGTPCYVDDIASALVMADALELPSGIYHLRNEGFCNWASYARHIIQMLKLDCRVIDVPSTDYPRPAARPENSTLSVEKWRGAGGAKLPHWEDAVARYLGSN